MSGINYDLKLIRGLAFDVDGVLSPSTIPMNDEGVPLRMVNIKDGYALQLAVKKGLKITIITGGNTNNVKLRYGALGISDIYIGQSHKIDTFRQWMGNNKLDPSEVIYMGDDIPDLQCLRAAGLACCPHDACGEVRMTSRYISPIIGGYGCVRDVLEQVLKAQGLWLSDAKAFGW